MMLTSQQPEGMATGFMWMIRITEPLYWKEIPSPAVIMMLQTALQDTGMAFPMATVGTTETREFIGTMLGLMVRTTEATAAFSKSHSLCRNNGQKPETKPAKRFWVTKKFRQLAEFLFNVAQNF